MELVTRSQVHGDVEQASDWYDMQRQGLGTEFAEEVARTIDSLISDPLAPQIRVVSKNIRWVHTNRFPFYVVYKVVPNNGLIIVGAVIHSARSGSAWRNRF